MSIVRLLLLTLVLSAPTRAFAHDHYAPQPAPPPVVVQQVPVPYYVAPPYRHRRMSILGHGFRGVWSGALVGLGASYFVARHSADSFRAVGLSTSLGAVCGAGLGLGLGVLDQAGVQSAYYITRDLSLGVLFGAAVGAIAGGIVAIGGADREAILIGAAAGSIAGFGLGVITGILEGAFRRGPYDDYYASRRTTLSVAQLAPDTRTWGARLSGRF